MRVPANTAAGTPRASVDSDGYDAVREPSRTPASPQPASPVLVDEKDGLEDDAVAGTASSYLGDIPYRYRLLAFSMILLFATGSSFAQDVLSPLKSTIKKELGVNNAQYGAIDSASSLVNTILPLIGGLWMDRWGATYAAIICSVFIMIGAIVSGVATSTSNYRLLIGGQIIMGLGSTVIEGCQSKLYAHWFRGSGLALVFAVDIAWNRVTSIVAKATAVPMSEVRDWWGWALWIPAVLCAANLALCVGYWYYERSVPLDYRPPLGKYAAEHEGWRARRFGIKPLLCLPKFFWIFTATQVFQNATVSVYTSNLADMQTVTRGTSTLAAGYNSSLQGIVPIVCTPLAGWFFDRYGWRMIFVSWTATLYIVVFALIGLTTVHPLGPIILSSFALSTNAITFTASIPVLVGNDALLGTAFGIWKAYANCNTIILTVVAGAVQDATPGGGYDRVIYMIIAIKALELAYGPLYDYLDGRWLGHSLRMPEGRRVAFRSEVKKSARELEGWRASRPAMYACGALLTALIVTGWTVYIVYSLGT
ncbi:hypothetical protein Q5752_000146 [Cryptotrichosporon argae]